MEERLQKIIARAGIASRRHAEEMIASGLVTVNGATITELGTKADESRDHIKVAGKLLRPAQKRVYLLLHKPAEVVSTMSDPEGRRSLRDLLHGIPERVFPVGRLEYHAAGLVFLTNDGDLANLLLRSHRIRQTYHLKLKTLLTFAEIESLGRATGAHIERLRGKESPWYVVALSEARRDALRNKLFQTGHPVEKIRRVRIAKLELGALAPGSHRELSSPEVAAFRRAIVSGDGFSEAAPKSESRFHAKYVPRPVLARKPRRTAPGHLRRTGPGICPPDSGDRHAESRHAAHDKSRRAAFRPGQRGSQRGSHRASSSAPQGAPHRSEDRTPPRKSSQSSNRSSNPSARGNSPRAPRRFEPRAGRNKPRSRKNKP